MGELRRFIKSNNVIMRIVSIVLAVAVLASAFTYFSNENMESVSAEEGSTKPYMEYIVQRLIDGIQQEFNVLEIVPYKAQGEFRYYGSDKEVEEGLEARQDYLEQLYKNTGRYKKSDGKWDKVNEWVKINEPYYNYNYEMMYNSDTEKFEVRGSNTYPKYVLPEYEDLIIEKLNVNTVEANDVTAEDISKADFILINTGTHDSKTITAYREFTNDREQLVYTKDGVAIADNETISYDTFEKVDADSVPEEEDDIVDPDDPVITNGNVYFKNSAGWGKVYIYYYSAEDSDMVEYPGIEMTLVEDETDIYYAQLPSNVDYIDFNNGSTVALQSYQTTYEGFEKIYSGGEWLDYPIVEEEPSTEETSTEGSTEEGSTEEGSTEEATTEEPTTEEPTTEEPTTGGSTGGTTEPEDEFAYISRDMSWKMCETLLDYIIKGRTLELPDGSSVTVKTPVVIDNQRVSELSQDGNIYKMMLIYRMCSSNSVDPSGITRWDVLKEYISTKDVNGNKYRNAAGIVTPAMDVSGAGFTSDAVTTWIVGNQNVIRELFNRVAPGNKTSDGKNLPAYSEEEPFMANHLTDDYWVYSGVNWIIPSQVDATLTGIGSDFTSRIGSSIKAIDVLRYLLGAKASQTYSFTDKVRVLEIQPCNCFEYDTLDKIKELGRKLLRANYNSWTNDGKSTDYRNYITIDYVTPNALNAMTVDIASEYDLVIIGDNIGDESDKNRLTQQDGKTIFNDRNLNGYVYLAFGDLLKVSTYALGYLPDEYIELSSTDSKTGLRKVDSANKHVWTPYLYSELSKSTGSKYFVVRDMENYYITKSSVKKVSGSSSKIDNESFYLDHKLGNTRVSDNDITDITKEKLISYVKTGNPIVVADSVYNADPTKLYPTSDMYDFAKNTLCATDTNGDRLNRNVLRKETIGTAVAFLGTKAPRINFVQGDVTYIKRTNSGGVDSYNTVTETLPIKPVEPKYIGDDATGTGGTICTFNNRELHYKFNITGQVGKKYIVKLLIDKNNDGVYNENDLGLADDKNEVYFTKEVKLNQRTVTYEINTALADNFIGMLAWKLEIVELDESGKETEWRVSEKGYSAIRNEDNRLLKVLQIAPNKTGKGNYLEMDTSTNFQNLMNKVEGIVGYDIQVERIWVSDFVNQYKGSGKKYTKGQLGTSVDKLNSYDMVVLGFDDSYGSQDINNDYGALDNLLDYMDAGKAVLFTHDTVSWRSTPNYKAGYLNGSSMKLLSPGSIYDTKADGTHGSQTKYGDTCFNLTINFRNRVGMDKYGVTLTKEERIAQGKEIPMYAEGYDKPSYMGDELEVRELQGFNNWNSYRMNYCFRARSSYDSDGKNYTSLRPFADGDYYNGGNGGGSVMFTTKQVVQLNEGPITMYPYNVGTTVSIAETHGQYFELDMEDEDIVVWYALDSCSSLKTSDYYKKTYKDGGNNYYIYSKNNITYSGAGHQDMKDSIPELKLFVNTIVKAIAGGNSEPIVTVTNGGVVSGGSYVVYVNSADAAKDYEIDFKAEDADLVSFETTGGNINLVGEFTSAEVYWLKPLEGGGSEEVLIKSDGYKYADINTGNLKNGIIQYMRLSDTNLKDDAEALDKIEKLVEVDKVGANFKIVVKDSRGVEVSVAVQLQERDLFNMD
ncbi:MAG: DUF5057 domain-containing protein [Lachnospiraceae bacterium]|nr:DUF5057 domain-containing protein [Lachnospiraceae bacterium]